MYDPRQVEGVIFENQQMREVCTSLTDKNECLTGEIDQFKAIIKKQNNLIDTVRQKYSKFLKKVSIENEQLKAQLVINEENMNHLNMQNQELQEENQEKTKKLESQLLVPPESHNQKQLIHELTNDKKDLKNEIKILRKKIKKHKYRYRTLNKVISEQQAIKMMPSWGYASIDPADEEGSLKFRPPSVNSNMRMQNRQANTILTQDTYLCNNETLNENSFTRASRRPSRASRVLSQDKNTSKNQGILLNSHHRT